LPLTHLTKCSAYGLRKIGAVRAAGNGASEHELMALFGWENPEMARIYTRKAAQKRMAVSAAAKIRRASFRAICVSHRLSH